MRSNLFSAIIIASTVSCALGAPAAESVSFASVSPASVASASVASASVNARPSAMAEPIPNKWDHMKMTLPDSLFSEDRRIVPMMVMDDDRDKTVQKSQQIKGYKKNGLTENGKASPDITEVTPLLPSLQNDASITNRISINAGKRTHMLVLYIYIYMYI
jgi:hypothetical protein